MKFDYTIESVPDAKDGYNVAALTEGTLIVLIGDQMFLQARGVLLVEFATVLQDWLSQGGEDGAADLYYASMDFEEEPIFALVHDGGSQCFRPAAVWANGAGAPVSGDDARAAAALFISELGSELAGKHGIDLPSVMADAKRDSL